MRSFFKIFFASLLALVAFVVILFAFTAGFISSIARFSDRGDVERMGYWCWT